MEQSKTTITYWSYDLTRARDTINEAFKLNISLFLLLRKEAMTTNISNFYFGTLLLALPLLAIHQYFLSAAVYTIRIRLKRYSGEKTFWFTKVGDQISGYLMIILGMILPLIFLVLPLTLGVRITSLWITYVFILIVDLVWLGTMKRGYWELVKINQGWYFFPLIKFPRKIHNLFFQPAWAMWLTLIALFLVIVWDK